MTVTAANPDLAPEATVTAPSAATEAPPAKAAKKAAKTSPPPAVAEPRKPLDPVEKPLWRMKRADRREILQEFLGKRVKVERWFGRVAAKGDQTYTGELVSIAWTTTGSTADFLILRMVDGMDWAISTAQVRHVMLAEVPRSRTAAATAARKAKAAAARGEVKSNAA